MDARIRLKLETAIIKHDQRASKGKYYNRYALGQYCAALQRVEESVDGGMSLADALRKCFNDRLLSKLEKSVDLPVSADKD
jgi:hypothetical protein